MTRELAAAGALMVGLLARLGAAPARSATDPFLAMDVDRAGLPVPAPDVAFRSLEGREVRLGALRGKVVLLGFFTTT